MGQDFWVGVISSTISYTATYPIDVIKTNYQLKTYNQTNIKINSLIKDIYKIDGIRGFYRGLSSSLSTYPIFWGVFFQTLDSTNVFVASSFASLIANPLFVLKTRFQSSKYKNQNYLKLIKNIYALEGYRGFLKGYVSTCINNTKLCIQFPLYDYLKSETNSVVLASMMSKIVASTIYYPTDLIRTNQRNSATDVKFIEAAKNIFKTSGIRGFYRGVTLYNAISIPNFILMMVVRDWMK